MALGTLKVDRNELTWIGSGIVWGVSWPNRGRRQGLGTVFLGHHSLVSRRTTFCGPETAWCRGGRAPAVAPGHWGCKIEPPLISILIHHNTLLTCGETTRVNGSWIRGWRGSVYIIGIFCEYPMWEKRVSWNILLIGNCNPQVSIIMMLRLRGRISGGYRIKI